MASTVLDNSDKSRFEIYVDNTLAGWVDYRLRNGEYSLPHTQVLAQFGGRGIGTELIIATLNEISNRGGSVLPFCPFIPRVMAADPGLLALVPEDRRAEFGL